MLEDNCMVRSSQENWWAHRSCGLALVSATPSRRFCRAEAAWLDVAAHHPDPGLSQRLKFAYDGRRHDYH